MPEQFETSEYSLWSTDGPENKSFWNKVQPELRLGNTTRDGFTVEYKGFLVKLAGQSIILTDPRGNVSERCVGNGEELPEQYTDAEESLYQAVQSFYKFHIRSDANRKKHREDMMHHLRMCIDSIIEDNDIYNNLRD